MNGLFLYEAALLFNGWDYLADCVNFVSPVWFTVLQWCITAGWLNRYKEFMNTVKIERQGNKLIQVNLKCHIS